MSLFLRRFGRVLLVIYNWFLLLLILLELIALGMLVTATGRLVGWTIVCLPRLRHMLKPCACARLLTE